MIPFTAFYGMRMNPFDKELPSRDAYKTLDMEQTQGRAKPFLSDIFPTA